MRKRGNFKGYWGIIALAALLLFAVSACDTSNADPDVVYVPQNLKNTEWEHGSGTVIVFYGDSVVINGTTYKLTEVNEGSSETILVFGGENVIVIKNGQIFTVSVGDTVITQNDGEWEQKTEEPPITNELYDKFEQFFKDCIMGLHFVRENSDESQYIRFYEEEGVYGVACGFTEVQGEVREFYDNYITQNIWDIVSQVEVRYEIYPESKTVNFTGAFSTTSGWEWEKNFSLVSDDIVLYRRQGSLAYGYYLEEWEINEGAVLKENKADALNLKKLRVLTYYFPDMEDFATGRDENGYVVSIDFDAFYEECLNGYIQINTGSFLQAGKYYMLPPKHEGGE